MRLIDADNVKELISEELDKHFNRWDNTITVAEMETIARDAIDNTPTVEAIPTELHEKILNITTGELLECQSNLRPQGEWKDFITPLPLSDHHYKMGVICSECNTTWDCSTNYCPYCGADMRGNNNV